MAGAAPDDPEYPKHLTCLVGNWRSAGNSLADRNMVVILMLEEQSSKLEKLVAWREAWSLGAACAVYVLGGWAPLSPPRRRPAPSFFSDDILF